MKAGHLNKQTFLQGAFILVAANSLVKIIGAIFKIPLTYLIHEDGMGIFNTAYIMYTWMFVIATAGLPIAVSKMVSESVARNNRPEAHKVFSVSFYLLSFVGLAGTAVLFFGARFFANALNNPRAYLAIMAVAPALFFVAVMSAYRGYFQGLQNMIPTAVSEVIEALGKLVVGYALAYFWLWKGVEYSSAGAVLGVSTGAFLGAVGLFFVYRISKKSSLSESYSYKNSSVKMRSAKQILIELIKIAVPITIGASVFSLTNVIDLAMIMNRLKSIGLSDVDVSRLYGSYSGYAVPLFNLPATLIVALVISIVPAIASAYAVNNVNLARKTTESAIRITILFSLPSALGLSVLSKPILQLIYRNDRADELLSILGIAVVFVSIVLVTNAILQASGRVMVPVKNMLIGGVVKVVINYFLVGNPEININGAPIGTNVCYLLIVVLNLIEVKKVTGAKYRLMDFFIKPLIAAFSMAITATFTYNRLLTFTGSGNISTMVAIGIGGLVYIIMLFAIGGLNKDDIEMMPKGKKIISLFNRFGVLK